jgi:hypothetical protein
MMDTLARIVLWLLCPAFLLKTGTFVWMAWRIKHQENRTAIGRALVWWCAGLSLVSIALTALFGVFTWRFSDDDLAWWLWIMVPLIVGLVVTDYYGWRVVREEGKLPV